MAHFQVDTGSAQHICHWDFITAIRKVWSISYKIVAIFLDSFGRKSKKLQKIVKKIQLKWFILTDNLYLKPCYFVIYLI